MFLGERRPNFQAPFFRSSPSLSTVRLPAGHDTTKQGVSSLKAAPQREVRMAKRILAVDDEPHIVRLLQIHFTALGYEVLPAHDGEAALRQVAEAVPDLILLDVTMPKMDGFAVLRRLKADPEGARIPVIMLTARGQFRDMAEGYGQGAEWYFHK